MSAGVGASAAVVLGTVVLAVVASATVLTCFDEIVPDALLAIGTTAVGALAGLLAPQCVDRPGRGLSTSRNPEIEES